jgi:hypothetical protein
MKDACNSDADDAYTVGFVRTLDEVLDPMADL